MYVYDMTTPATTTSIIEQLFKILAVGEHEAAAYTYCLQQGPQRMSELARVLGVQRTNMYALVERLEQKGLCYRAGAAGGQRVIARPPRELTALFDTKIRDIEAVRSHLDEVTAALAGEQEAAAAGAPRVSYFAHAENVRAMIWMSIHARTKRVRCAGSELDLAAALGRQYVVEYHQIRAQQGVRLQRMQPGTKRLVGDVFHDDAAYLREVRIRPEGIVKLKANMLVWDDAVALYTLTKHDCFGTLIRDAALATMLASWFDVIWEVARPAPVDTARRRA